MPIRSLRVSDSATSNVGVSLGLESRAECRFDMCAKLSPHLLPELSTELRIGTDDRKAKSSW